MRLWNVSQLTVLGQAWFAMAWSSLLLCSKYIKRALRWMSSWSISVQFYWCDCCSRIVHGLDQYYAFICHTISLFSSSNSYVVVRIEHAKNRKKRCSFYGLCWICTECCKELITCHYLPQGHFVRPWPSLLTAVAWNLLMSAIWAGIAVNRNLDSAFMLSGTLSWITDAETFSMRAPNILFGQGIGCFVRSEKDSDPGRCVRDELSCVCLSCSKAPLPTPFSQLLSVAWNSCHFNTSERSACPRITQS